MIKTYPRYQESDIDWIGKIPVEWNIDRIKDVIPKIYGGATPKSSEPEYWMDGDIIWLTPTDFQKFRNCIVIDDSEKKITVKGLENCSATLLPMGTVIMASRATIGIVKIAGKELCTNQGFISFICDDFSNKFFYYIISANLGVIFEAIASGTTFKEISRNKVKNEYIAFPEKIEQKRITTCLDKTCYRIDAAIDSKRKQLEKLDGLRKSIIHEAVTKGLDDSVEMKDSGIEWIGESPKNWKVTRLKDVAHIRYGLGQPPEKDEDGIPMIRATNIRAGRIDNNNLMKVDCKDLPMNRNPFLRKGEIVVVRSGAYTGDSAIIPSEYDGCISGYDMVVSTHKASSKFIAYGLLSYYILDAQILLLTLRAAQPHLNAEQLGSIMILLPDMIEEQNAIADYLDKKNKEISTIESNLEKQISTLEQYHKSLIYECVTGKRRITEQDLKKVGADV